MTTVLRGNLAHNTNYPGLANFIWTERILNKLISTWWGICASWVWLWRPWRQCHGVATGYANSYGHEALKPGWLPFLPAVAWCPRTWLCCTDSCKDRWEGRCGLALLSLWLSKKMVPCVVHVTCHSESLIKSKMTFGWHCIWLCFMIRN